MSKLEARAKPWLLSMINGRRRTYHDQGQTLVATWAVKTALMAGSPLGEPATPASFYSDLYAHKMPGEGSRVWIGASQLRGMTYIDHRPCRVTLNGQPPPTENGYATLLGIGHLLLYVFARESGGPSINNFGPFKDAFEQIRPIEGPKTYPPGRVLPPDALNAVAETVGRAA